MTVKRFIDSDGDAIWNESSLEKKYRHAILVLQAIAQRDGSSKAYGFNEWTQAAAFCDCREAARRCLLKLGEKTYL